ncbi:tRNA (adenine(58)-N(1))-methyltransferase, mitochondrial [Rana temporaria]|uniref:tRNA (adenine(58)-N(1))-methyltransferase, mitochondrial n=1 Tax=Rana temporaria TaxID=8407 RepID=UPI001AAD8480|nr:tRNA (adenine(58)-N(1))-methyltransferase, mitochondrial [Rana temporaria]
MFPGRKVPLLCRALLSRTLPPAGGADSLLSCRLRALPAVSHSDYPGGGSREDVPGAQEGALGVPESARARLLRRAWGRSLSPLDRVSRMIPPELISKEVQDLRGPDLSTPAGEGPLDQVAPPPSSTFHVGQEDIGASAPLLGGEVRDLRGPERSIPPGKGSLHQAAPPPSSQGSPFHVEPEDVGAPGPPRRNEVSGGFENLAPPHGEGATENTSWPHPPTPTPEADGDLSPPQGAPFCPGDLLLAEYQRKHRSVFRKMFLLKPHGKLVSNWGAIGNQDIMGQLPGQRLLTSTGHTLLLRRPSLEEYVCFMRRGPNITYPKDMAAMMMAMDVGPGDVVLEAGSGSGACSLFLSRAVGSEGAVYSFEVRADHHDVAKRNFSNWRKAWQIRSGGRTWPDNVRFINKSVTDAFPDIQSVAFDAAALDMLNPQVALPVITRNLKPGAVCAVYIANITQVIDLLEGIRCCKLPLVCEKIVEVGVTDWLVAPSVRKDGKISKRVDPQTPEQLHREEEEEDDDETDGGDEGPAGSEAFGQVPYIARPLPWQTGHTAFLAHLRKFIPTPPTDPEDSS